MTPPDNAVLAEGLDRALDELLTVRLALHASRFTVPDMALDKALREHSGFQDARLVFAAALAAALAVVDGDERETVFAVENTVNALVWTAADAAWRMAQMTKALPP